MRKNHSMHVQQGCLVVTNQINVWSSTSGVEAGLICLFIEQHILNEVRVSNYIQAILRHEQLYNFILMIKIEFLKNKW